MMFYLGLTLLFLLLHGFIEFFLLFSFALKLEGHIMKFEYDVFSLFVFSVASYETYTYFGIRSVTKMSNNSDKYKKQ
jgi:hypothetical protein